MTTNTTPIEAIKEIEKILPELLTYSDKKDYIFEKIGSICTQALAPQECDVTKCEFIGGDFRCGDNRKICLAYSEEGFTELCEDKPNCYYKQQYKLGKAYNDLFNKYINEGADFEIKIKNLEKQLHSQQKTFFKTDERATGVEDRDYIKGEKTFTVEEIRKVMTDYMRSKRKFGLQLNPTRINELLAEFEKAVG